MMLSRIAPFALAVLCAAPHAAAQRSIAQVRDYERTRAYRECSNESIRRLGLFEGGRVADIGAGYGFYSEQLSPVVGASGRVFAVEVDSGALRMLRERVRVAALKNVEVIEGRAGDPLLSRTRSTASSSFAHTTTCRSPQTMLAKMHAALKPGGRLVMLDHRNGSSAAGDSRARQVSHHELAMDLVARELASAGFEIIEKLDSVCEGQPNASSRGERLWLMLSRKP